MEKALSLPVKIEESLTTYEDRPGFKWVQYHDMNSGGGRKEWFRYLLLEVPAESNEGARRVADSVFYAAFGHSPERVSCTCCGEDYSIDVYSSLADATAYQRGLRCVIKKEGGRYIDSRYIEPNEPVPDGYTLSKSYGLSEYRLRELGFDMKDRPNGVTLAEYFSGLAKQDKDDYDSVSVVFWDQVPAKFRGQPEPPEEGYIWH